jgi:hypothetical protein
MGLIIKSTEERIIQYKDLSGNVQVLESVYARLEWASRIDGKSVEVAFPYIFISKDAFLLGASMIQTDIQTNVSGEVIVQDNPMVHELCKIELEKLGYLVQIDL